jgi:DNA topoisomerase VI subunit B
MSASILARKTFRTSRLAEFASKAELVRQIGHAVEQWPLVVVKELIDNALDAAEEAGVAPEIKVVVERDRITVADAGDGIAPETVAALVDYSARTSSREAYVSPTRGAQGNALQTILAMPLALDGEKGETIIESHGIAHRIVFDVDPVV